jgi:hypothetical protein
MTGGGKEYGKGAANRLDIEVKRRRYSMGGTCKDVAPKA